MTDKELAKKWSELNDQCEIETNNLQIFREKYKDHLKVPQIADEIIRREKKIIELRSKANVVMAERYNLSFNTLTSNHDANKKSR